MEEENVEVVAEPLPVAPLDQSDLLTEVSQDAPLAGSSKFYFSKKYSQYSLAKLIFHNNFHNFLYQCGLGAVN